MADGSGSPGGIGRSRGRAARAGRGRAGTRSRGRAGPGGGAGRKAREIVGRRRPALGDVVGLSRHTESLTHRTGLLGSNHGQICSGLSAQAGPSLNTWHRIAWTQFFNISSDR